ncbi:mitochondrial amidoxime reducing component 2-like [Euwallacea similis]|uniref:mitochondrial amidoxime reducing component 2-like n=1 Tax=Euwallacea similis TaxID=1736056 RepID=UPI00344E97D2
MAPPVITATIAIGVGSAFFTILSILLLKKLLNREKIPSQWQQVGTVKDLFVYPLKSGHSIRSEALFLTDKGVKETNKKDNSIELRDRSFLIYTSKGKEVRTARQIPKTILITIQAAENGIILSAPNKIDLYVIIPKVKNDVKHAIWDSIFGNEPFTCTDCGESVAEWLSTLLLDKVEGLRLGYGDGSIARNVLRDHKKWAEFYTNMDNSMAGIFSDLAALHLVNEATVEDLSEKLPEGQKISFKNFRPNVLVEGSEY